MGAETSIPDRVLEKVCGSHQVARRDGFWQQLMHLLHAEGKFFCLLESCAEFTTRHGGRLCQQLVTNNPKTRHFQVCTHSNGADIKQRPPEFAVCSLRRSISLPDGHHNYFLHSCN